MKDTFVSFELILSLDLICALANFFPDSLLWLDGSGMVSLLVRIAELPPPPFPFPSPLKINVTSSGTAGKRPRREKWMERGM